jgi:beta-lactamase class A
VRRILFLTGAAGALVWPLGARATTYDHLEAIARDVPGVLGVSCRTLGDGPPALSYNAATQFPTASTIKVLIMATAYVAEEREPGSLDARITFRRSDLIGGSDFLSLQPDGKKFTVRDLIVPMIRVSDNTASNLLITHYGFEAINATGVAAGMTNTRMARHFLDFRAIVNHNDNVTTPQDMTTLLFAIARGAHEGTATIASAEHCRRMVKIMLGQTDRDAIPEGLPRHVVVANKTGEIDGTRNDVAIVSPFGDAPYVLAVYTKWLTNYAEGYAAIHRIARLSYRLVGSAQG